MKDFIKRMIEEHKQLVSRIESLHEYVYGDKANADNKAEFANKCIQLKAMKVYEEALRARLNNNGIAISYDCQYFENVTEN